MSDARDCFDPSQSTYKGHLPFLDRRLCMHFLLDRDPLLRKVSTEGARVLATITSKSKSYGVGVGSGVVVGVGVGVGSGIGVGVAVGVGVGNGVGVGVGFGVGVGHGVGVGVSCEQEMPHGGVVGCTYAVGERPAFWGVVVVVGGVCWTGKVEVAVMRPEPNGDDAAV